MKKFIAVFLVLLVLTGCTPKPQSLTADYGNRIKEIDFSDPDAFKKANAELASELLKGAYDKKNGNTLISPLSISLALAMTLNGANGETLSQMETVFGMNTNDLNNALASYVKDLSENEVNIANSLWIKDKKALTVEEDFLKTCSDYYGAEIFKEKFDSATLKKINNWIEDETDGLIKKALDRIDGNDVIYLINALAFDAKWQDVYEKSNVKNGEFTALSGKRKNVKMLHSTESIYLEDKDATGFIKKYSGGDYAFVAILPKGDINGYVSSLTGKKLQSLLETKSSATVKTKMPKFSYDYGTELNDVFASLGMSDAFNPEKSDFSNMAHSDDGNIYISRIIHKTHITVDELGTKAGAATVIVNKDCSAPFSENIKEVYLDRPFMYMIIDTKNQQPLFLGVTCEI